ncbi:hypothetical protein GYMLUDRAFT_110416, partial [Collybiopsis luxurians FD-317 M1]
MKRQSELSSNIDSKIVIGRLMNTEVTLPIKEVLGTSGEVCKHLGEMIHLKNPREPRENSSTISAHKAGQEHLIRLQLTSNGTKIEGILDTGSELNIVSHCIAEKLAK